MTGNALVTGTFRRTASGLLLMAPLLAHGAPVDTSGWECNFCPFEDGQLESEVADLGDLADQAAATVTIKVLPTAIGTITNQAGVDSTQSDANPADNSDTEETLVGPGQGYPRPKSASPVRVSLVPAYRQCTAPNRVHGPPLAFAACGPPAQQSADLTVGTPDANGKAPSSVGYARAAARAGDPATPADEADVRVEFEITDVRRRSDLSDYAGEVQLNAQLRITDRFNGTSPGGSQAGTVVDLPFPVPGVCVATPNPSVGGRCVAVTTFDAVVPNAVAEGKRAIWAFGQFRVIDGGADGEIETVPNTLFAVQGVFIP